MDAIGAIVTLGGICAGLPTSDPTANATNLLDIVNAVRLLLEQELVQMATERRGSKWLTAVLAIPVLGRQIAAGFRVRLVIGPRVLRRFPGGFFLHG